MDPALKGKYEEWMRFDQNEDTRREMEKLASDGDIATLKKLLLRRMQFGTAGLRAKMGAGYSCMNDLTIIQTTQGFAKYMLATDEDVSELGVVIGYDARHNSYRWAQIAANILVSSGIRTFLYSTVTPTPFVAFGVLQLHCVWGIMITASHNPACDNGYKVYYRNGAQIIAPHSDGISKAILSSLVPLERSWNFDALDSSDLLSDPLAQVWEAYYGILPSLMHRSVSANSLCKTKFTYSAMHGVGYEAIKKAFQVFGFAKPIPVEKQVLPDPDFPTVQYPNPEEGKSALNLSMETAHQHGSPIILANDPDADRLAIAERQSDGTWHVFSGNQLGALFGWWFTINRSKEMKDSNVNFLSSTVSSKILKSICEAEGFTFTETLTGFKWMGNISSQLLRRGEVVLFAFEEAIGFMCGSHVLDKDGVSACIVAAEMVAEVYQQGHTLYKQLDLIYQKYGYHIGYTTYFISHDPQVTIDIFTRLRNFDELGGGYPSACAGLKIKAIRDLTIGYDSREANKRPTLPTDQSSQMITFYFDEVELTIRTSGTEPKIKIYAEKIDNSGQSVERSEQERHLVSFVNDVVESFLQPQKHRLQPKAD